MYLALIQSQPMDTKHKEDNPGPKKKIEDPLISDILRALFKYENIEFESVGLIHWKIIEDTVVAEPLKTLGDIATLSKDGGYHIAIKHALISDIEEESIEIPEINVEVSFKNGQWSDPRIYTDYESCTPQCSSPEALQSRLEKLKEKVAGGLQLVSLVLRVANELRDMLG